MPSRTAPLPNANRAQRQIQFVINDDQIRLRLELMLCQQLAQGQAAQVHVGLRLGQENLLVTDNGPGSQCPAIPVSHVHAPFVGEAIDGEKS